jgi:Protein of unknown function (DUF3040)
MSLSARERQTLEDIEDELACSDPDLADRMAMFTRLTAGDEMPAREMTGTGRRSPGGRGLWHRLVLRAGPVLWLVIALSLIAAALVMKGSTRPCSGSWPAGCAKPASVHFSGLGRYQIIS